MPPLTSPRIEGPDDPAALFTDMVSRGLTDGLPVIPPTEALVQAMVDASGLASDTLVAIIPPEGGPATVEKLAVNAVMAGCLPEHFPVVIAAIRALAEPQFNLLGVQTTTNPVAPVLVVNGPVRRAIGIECGRGCMGPGFRANATIGRAVRLALRNVGACPPGDVSKSIHGMPGRFTFCFGELEEESPWPPLHVELGYRAEQSTVTVFGGQGTQNLYASFRRPESIVHMVADGMRCYGNNGYLRGSGNPLVVISPGHARVFAEGGWDKTRIRQALYERTFIPLEQVAEERQLANPYYAQWDRSRSIPLCRTPEDIVILVAGGPEAYHVTYIPSFASTTMVTAAIDLPRP
jgi:hypothetical protein